MPMKVMLGAIFNNDCGSSMFSTIGMLYAVDCVFGNFDAIFFFGEMCFINQHDVDFLILCVSFDFFSMLGEPIIIP